MLVQEGAQFPANTKMGRPLGGDVHRLPASRIAACPNDALTGGEHSETTQLHATSIC